MTADINKGGQAKATRLGLLFEMKGENKLSDPEVAEKRIVAQESKR